MFQNLESKITSYPAVSSDINRSTTSPPTSLLLFSPFCTHVDTPRPPKSQRNKVNSLVQCLVNCPNDERLLQRTSCQIWMMRCIMKRSIIRIWVVWLILGIRECHYTRSVDGQLTIEARRLITRDTALLGDCWLCMLGDRELLILGVGDERGRPEMRGGMISMCLLMNIASIGLSRHR